jgi:cell division protein FtsN
MISAGLFYAVTYMHTDLIKHRTKPNTHLSTTVIPLSKKKKTHTRQTQTNQSENFDFSFYNMLPKMHVSSPKVNTPPPASKHLRIKKQYYLQTASTKNKQNAEQLVKQLHQYGFPAVMSVTVRRHRKWYHIFLGPYTYLNKAKKAQYRLYRDYHMSGILRIVDNTQQR